MTAKNFINERHPKLVKNWGDSAELLSFNQVIKLMEDFHEEDWPHTLIRKDKPRIEKYLCIKDYHPIITTKDGKRPTKKAIIKKGIILTFASEINAYRHKSDALYEYTLRDYKDCFKPLKNE